MPFLVRRGRKAPSWIRFAALLSIAITMATTMTRASTKMGMNKLLLQGRFTAAMRHHFGFVSFLLPLSTSAFAWVAPVSVPLRDYHRESHFRSEFRTQSFHLHIYKPFQTSPPVHHRLFSTANTNNDIEPQTIDSGGKSNVENPPNDRAKLLNECLNVVLKQSAQESSTTPAEQLMEAALESLRNPSGGYDPKYGRPALRAYRSFVYPKQSSNSSNSNSKIDKLQLEAMAKRTANQIDFLVKRQTSRMNQAVRNHDDPNNTQATDSETQQAGTKFPITLVLDNLRGSFNVGSIFRTAEACGVSKILTCGITPHPFGSGAEKVAKSALGADLLVPTAHFATTYEALQHIKSPAHAETNDQTPPAPFVVALETTAASKLYTSMDYRPYFEPNQNKSQGIALILGNEVTGVDVELLEPLLQQENDSETTKDTLVDAIVELPTHGQKNSLNVAAVAPVILYEILRQWDSTNTKPDQES